MTKKNHFNAKAYLKSFEYQQGSESCFTTKRISKKDKQDWAKIGNIPVNIDGLCYLFDFYTDFTDQGPDREKFEKLFKDSFEDDWPKIVRKLKNLSNLALVRQEYEKNEVLSDEEIKTLITFIILQFKRTPRTRDLLVRTGIKISKRTMRRMRKENPRATKRQIEEMIFHKTHLYFLEYDQPHTEMMLKKLSWGIIVNTTPTPFITSDSPVLWIGDGIKIDGTDIIFVPITPKIAIMIPINILHAKNKIHIQQIDETKVKEINNAHKNRTIKGNNSYSRLISNNKNALDNLINS